MNLNKISLIVVVATLVLTGCNNDLALQSETSEKAIEFVTVIDKTRASLINDKEELTSFFLHAGASGTGDLSFMKVAAYKDDDDGWTYAPKKYWPGYDLDFYAYTPIMDVNMDPKPTKTGVSVTFGYEVPADQSVSNTAVDLLVAYAPNERGTGNVALNFKHALSSVIFSAKNLSSNFIFNIHSIEIKNLHNKNTYTYGSGWKSIENDGKINYKAGIPESGVTIYRENDWLRLLSLNDYLLVLPQTYEIKKGVAVRVTYSSKNMASAIEQSKTVKFSLDNVINNKFEEGKRYNFKFTLDEDEVNEVSQVSMSVAIDNSVENDGHDEEVADSESK